MTTERLNHLITMASVLIRSGLKDTDVGALLQIRYGLSQEVAEGIAVYARLEDKLPIE